MAYIKVLNSKGKTVKVDKIDDKLATQKTRNANSRVRIISKKEYEDSVNKEIKEMQDKMQKLDPKKDSKIIQDYEKGILKLKNQGKLKKESDGPMKTTSKPQG